MSPNENFDLLLALKRYKSQYESEEFLVIEEIESTLSNEVKSFYIKESEFYNTVLVELESDPLETALKLQNTSINDLSQIVPIEEVVRTRPEYITEKVITRSREKMNPGETFVIRCNLRGKRYIESKEQLLRTIIPLLKKELQVETAKNKADWLIRIEVVGENTGISILRPSDLEEIRM